MLTPQLITEAAAIYERLKAFDQQLNDLDKHADRFYVAAAIDGKAQVTDFTLMVHRDDEREMAEEIRALLVERLVSRRRTLERRLAQIGAPVIPWPANPPGV